jgi:hypothetical protein
MEQARDDEYVNATLMCKACGKLWANYWQNNNSQEFLNELSIDIGIPISKLILTIRGRGDVLSQGTWVHRRVAIDLARRLSPKFAVWMTKLEFPSPRRPETDLRVSLRGRDLPSGRYLSRPTRGCELPGNCPEVNGKETPLERKSENRSLTKTASQLSAG